MMVGWQACFIVLVLGLASGRDYVETFTHVVREIDSCPDVGYFFKRDPSPNAVDPGPCHLCFCRDNGTAVCWERDSRRCDVEKYHHHRVGRQSRMCRSISLGDIFFRDASRDFFKRRLPEECEPFESSFSDGCPPADWCIGCTVCDCDANGRWDCHILSFCDGKETKKKVKANRALDSKRGDKRRNKARTGPSKAKTTTSTTTRPAKRIVKKYIQSKPKSMNKSQNKSKNTTQPRKIHANKQKAKKVTINKPLSQKPQPENPKKQKLRSQKSPPQLQKQQKQQQQKRQQQKPHEKKPQLQKPQLKKPKLNTTKLKIIKNGGVKRKQPGLQRENLRNIIIANRNDTHKLGQKVVKQVMSTVQKLLMKEMEKMNATRVQRSIDLAKKGCGGTKENENNVKSKKGGKKKRKHRKKSYTIKDNFYGDRFKREIVNEPQMDDENGTLGIPGNHSVIYLIDAETLKSGNGTSTDSAIDVNLTSTLQKVDYYKYSLINHRNETTNMASIENATDRNKPDAFFNFIIPFDSGRNNISNNDLDNGTAGTINPIFNDLHLTKWFVIKVMNDKKKKSVERLILLPKSKLLDDIKTAENVYLESKLEKKDFGTKYGTMKQKIHHLINSNCSRPLASLKNSSIRNETAVIGVQNLLRKLNGNVTPQQKLKPKLDIMKYVKRFFHKIFSKRKSKSHKIRVYGIGTKEDHTLQILCENIGACKINRNNKYILKYKLKQLNKETETILKSIRTIKGLLHLLELPEINGPNKNTSQNNIRKLSTILGDNYNIAETTAPLTDTQINQINYIKSNTNVFIESVRKFAEILNETITLLKPNTENKHTIELKKSEKNKIPFKRIRKILGRYNVVQNTFMRRMYELIHGQENKAPTTEVIQKQVKLKENSTDKVIENYSNYIIENLKKLKNLAKALSSNRKKRYIIERMDSTVEYLLTVMEYLIKQNYPFHAGPANDGIDNLLDAIKNAPEIKPIEDNVLDYIPTQKSVVKSGIIDMFENEQITTDSNSESSRISKEEKRLNKDSGSNDSNIWVVEQNTEIVFDVTPKAYYRTFNGKTNKKNVESDNETSQQHNNATGKHSTKETEKVGFDKFESTIDETKKFEAYAGEMEDDNNGDSTDNVVPKTLNSTDLSTQGAEEIITSSTNLPIVTTQSKEYSSESQDSRSDSKKTKLDWIEETFDREIREFSELNASYPSPTRTSSVPSTTAVYTSNNDNTRNNTDNVSGVTAEQEDAVERKKKSSKSHKPDNVMYKKEIEFLNSLDYGTDKPDFDDGDSKDDKSNDGKLSAAKSDDDLSVYYS